MTGCTERTAAERGAALFRSPDLSPSDTNYVACDTCHVPFAEPPDRILVGGSLNHVLGRPHYWNGAVLDPREAVNVCLRTFMRDPRPEPLGPETEDGLDLLAFFRTLGTDPVEPRAYTLAETLPRSLPPGDPARGAALYEAACRQCHGDAFTGEGRLSHLNPAIPDETIAEHGADAPAIVVAKVRRGGSYGIGGDMPPFSLELISDAQLADILAFFELSLE